MYISQKKKKKGEDGGRRKISRACEVKGWEPRWESIEGWGM